MTFHAGSFALPCSTVLSSAVRVVGLACVSLLVFAADRAKADPTAAPAAGKSDAPVARHDQKSAAASLKIDALDGGKSVRFVVSAQSGLKLNFDGPWQLRTKGLQTDAGDPGIYGKDAFEKSPKFAAVTVKLASAPKARQSGDYKLTYFICDDPTTWCKRATLEGEFGAATGR